MCSFQKERSRSYGDQKSRKTGNTTACHYTETFSSNFLSLEKTRLQNSRSLFLKNREIVYLKARSTPFLLSSMTLARHLLFKNRARSQKIRLFCSIEKTTKNSLFTRQILDKRLSFIELGNIFFLVKSRGVYHLVTSRPFFRQKLLLAKWG